MTHSDDITPGSPFGEAETKPERKHKKTAKDDSFSIDSVSYKDVDYVGLNAYIASQKAFEDRLRPKFFNVATKIAYTHMPEPDFVVLYVETDDEVVRLYGKGENQDAPEMLTNPNDVYDNEPKENFSSQHSKETNPESLLMLAKIENGFEEDEAATRKRMMWLIVGIFFVLIVVASFFIAATFLGKVSGS